jgi:hypothetical protein
MHRIPSNKHSTWKPLIRPRQRTHEARMFIVDLFVVAIHSSSLSFPTHPVMSCLPCDSDPDFFHPLFRSLGVFGVLLSKMHSRKITNTPLNSVTFRSIDPTTHHHQIHSHQNNKNHANIPYIIAAATKIWQRSEIFWGMYLYVWAGVE